MWLALTGAVLGGGGGVAVGLATHLVRDRAGVDALVADVEALPPPPSPPPGGGWGGGRVDPAEVVAVVERHAVGGGAASAAVATPGGDGSGGDGSCGGDGGGNGGGSVDRDGDRQWVAAGLPPRAWIADAFARPTVEAMADRLAAMAAAPEPPTPRMAAAPAGAMPGGRAAWAAAAAAALAAASPTSLKLSLATLTAASGGHTPLRECLAREWRVSQVALRRGEVRRGLAARGVGGRGGAGGGRAPRGGRRPAWEPPTLAGVSAAAVAAHLNGDGVPPLEEVAALGGVSPPGWPEWGEGRGRGRL